ncbi:ABC transporter ATP-binding protein [Roseibium sp.]|uniref:ABC transporter ATP-binding protein n=1 Tax=Roseibium sp. TaxID=1936156 RepID=UPI003B516C93
MAVLEVRGLTKHFPIHAGFLAKTFSGAKDKMIKAVDGVSFEVGEGEILGVAGESGCGKSTTCLLLSKLHKPSGGEILFKGRNIADLDADGLRQYRKDVQMIFQDPYESLNPRFTIFDTVAEGPRALKLWPEEEIQTRVMDMLADVGLRPEEYAQRYPHQMSGGERQRAGIACALVMKPELVIADEPLSMLDVSIRAGIMDLLKRLSTEMKFSCIYVSHDLSILSNVSQRLMIMYLGQVMEIGPTDEVIANPQHPYARALINAVAVPDPRYRRPIPDIRGEVAQPIDPPPGCRFAGRCPAVIDACGQDPAPRFVDFGLGHRSACHLVAAGAGS